MSDKTRRVVRAIQGLVERTMQQKESPDSYGTYHEEVELDEALEDLLKEVPKT